MAEQAIGQLLPDGWRMVLLREVADINRKTWTPKIGGSIRYLDLTAVTAPGRLSAPKDLAAEDAPSRARRVVRSGDTLISTVRPYLRGHVRISEAPPNLVASTGFAVVSPRSSIHDSLIFHHALGHSFRKHLEARMTGQAYPAVRPNDVESYRFALPSLDEQQAIAEVLDAIDDGIERTDEVISATERLREALLHELLSKGLPGWHTEWQNHPNLGTIPASWRMMRLGEIADVVGGSTPSRSEASFWGGSIPWVVPSEVSQLNGRHLRQTRDTISEAGARSASLKTLPAGSVLLTTRATIGVAAICSAPTTTNQGFQSLVPLDGTDSLWLFYRVCALSREFTRRAAGSTFREVSRQGVREAPVPFPPLAEQQAIAQVLDGVDNAIEQTGRQKAALATLKESMSDVLLTGQVRVRWNT